MFFRSFFLLSCLVALWTSFSAARAEVLASTLTGAPNLLAEFSGNGQACSLLPPGTRDRIGRYCGTGHAISLYGYILNDTCYFNANDAWREMNYARACHEPLRQGYCSLVQPGQRDAIGRYCTKAYGVSLNGYIVNNSCYFRADDALSLMQATRACYSGLHHGTCVVTQPSQRDQNGRYCDRAYGIMWRGSLLNNACYFRLDDAVAQMEMQQVCQ